MPKKKFLDNVHLAADLADRRSAVRLAEATFYRVEEGLCRDGGFRDPAAEAARGGEHEAQAAGGRSDAGQDHAAGCAEKKLDGNYLLRPCRCPRRPLSAQLHRTAHLS